MPLFPHPVLSALAGSSYSFNPADTSSLAVLSNGNRTLAAASGANGAMARSTVSKSAGRWYAEKHVDILHDTVQVGIGTSAAALNGNLGGDAFGYGYFSNGPVWNNGAAVATYATYGAGDTAAWAADFGARLIWFSKNGVWQSGDPASGTGGLSITSATYFDMAMVRIWSSSTVLDQLSIPGLLRYAPPLGFVPL